jgi:hypothetical protein
MKKIFSLLISSSLFFLACSGESSTNPVTNETVTKDLKKIASVVNTFSVKTVDPNTSDEQDVSALQVLNKKAVAEISDDEDSGWGLDQECDFSNIFIDSMVIDNETYIDTIKQFTIDNQPLSACNYSNYSDKVIQHSKSYYRSVNFESNITSVDTVDFNGDFFSFSSSLSGKVNYYNDDLVINIISGYVSARTVEEKLIVKILYNMEILEGKYKVTFDTEFEEELSFEDEEENVDEEAVAVVQISGPITDKNGTKVGTFQVKSDDSVVILDINGVVVKTTN